MKNYKQLICGIIIGATATVSISVLAEYIIHPNPYLIKVNGEITDIEGYNINDSTYFKLRDIAYAVGGLEVGFGDNTITVDTISPSPQPTSTPVANKDLEPLPKLPIEKRDGIQYVSIFDIKDVLKDIGLNNFSIIGHNFYNNDDIFNPLLKDIPCFEHDATLIPLDYYISTIISFINSLR